MLGLTLWGKSGELLRKINTAGEPSWKLLIFDLKPLPSVLLAVKRPPKHISQHMLQSGSTHLAVQKKASGLGTNVLSSM